MLLLGKTGDYDIIITEVGGNVGDMESQPFIEAIRQLQWELPDEDCMCIHLTLVPYLSAAKELKTKPTQHSVQMLQQGGVQPDVIVCRTEHPLSAELRKKVALFCNVKPRPRNPVYRRVEHLPGASQHARGASRRAGCAPLADRQLRAARPQGMDKFLERLKHPKHSLDIALVGKYVELQDAYKSILESFVHAGAVNECKVNVHTIQSETIHDDNVAGLLAGMNGVLVAPGFARGASRARSLP